MSLCINNSYNYNRSYKLKDKSVSSQSYQVAQPNSNSVSKKAAIVTVLAGGFLGISMLLKGKGVQEIAEKIGKSVKEKEPEIESGAKKIWERITGSTKKADGLKKAEKEAKIKAQEYTKLQTEREATLAKEKEVNSKKVEAAERDEQVHVEKNTEKPAVSSYSKLVNAKEEVENPEEVLQVMRELKQQPYNNKTSKRLVKLNKSEEYTYASVTAKPDGSQVVTYCDTPNYNSCSACPNKLIKKSYDKNGNEVSVLVIRPTKNLPKKDHYLPDFEVLEARNGSELHSIGTVEDTPFGQKIERLFTSMSGTKSEYNLIPTKNGHNIRYKITDKDGNVRMDMKRTFEKIDENHTKTTVNGIVYETEYNTDNIIVKKFDKSGNLTDTKTLDFGGGGYNYNFMVEYAEVPEYIIGNYKLDRNLTELYKQTEGDFLYKIADMGIRVRYGKPLEQKGCYINYRNTIFLSKERKDSPFVLLHELGHAVDDTLEDKAHINKILNDTKQLYMEKAGEIDKGLCFNYIMTGDEASAESLPILFGQLDHEPELAMRSLIFQKEFADYIAERSKMIY